MKKPLLLLLITTITFGSYRAQNWDFESWTSDTIDILDDYESITSENLNTKNDAVYRTTTDPHGGTSSIGLTPYVTDEDTIFGFIIVGSIEDGSNDLLGGMPVTIADVDSIIGYYRGDILAGDSVAILCAPKLAGVPATGAGVNMFHLTGTETTWKRFGFKVGSTAADSMIFALATGNPFVEFGGLPGSFVEFDDIQIKANDGSTVEILNGGFENWSDFTWEEPDHWNNTLEIGGLGADTLPIVKNNSAHSGLAALELNTIEDDGDTLVGIATNGVLGDEDPTGGEPFSGEPDSVEFYYIYTPQNMDTAYFSIEFRKGGSVVYDNSIDLDSTSSATYTSVRFGVPDGLDPDTVLITFFAGEHPGSKLIVDDLNIEKVIIPSTPPDVPSRQSFTIAENPFNGSDVGTVVAISDSMLTYHIINGTTPATNSGNSFAIDSLTGTITVADSTLIDYETITAFTLNVAVSAGDTTVNADVTINITDIDGEIQPSVGELNAASFNLYPNPTYKGEQLNIVVDHQNAYTINIMDVNGKQVQTFANLKGTQSISTDELDRGIYWLRLSTDNGSITKKITLQ